MLVNVEEGVRVLRAPLGASGAEAGSAGSLAIALYLRCRLGLLVICDGAVVGSAGAPGTGRGGAALSPGSAAAAWRSRASWTAVLSPWAPVSLGSARPRPLPE